jgi:hypothetical protein
MSWPEALAKLGVSPDPQRQLDHLAAVQSRQREDRLEAERTVSQLAYAIIKVRRQCVLTHADWVRSQSQEDLDAVTAAMRSRALLESELRELCCSDEELITAIMRRAGGR